MEPRATAVLLIPRTLDGFILRDQADDLLRSPGVVALDAPRVPYGAIGRLPAPLADRVAATVAARLPVPENPRAFAIFHPFQFPVARALIERHPGAELWYGRWDRYEHAYDADGRTRQRLQRLHDEAARTSALTFVASGKLAALEREAGRDATLVTLAADSFPAPDPTGTVIGVSLGHQGWRVDWTLVRELAAMPELILMLIGTWRDDQGKYDPDYQACRSLPNVLWLGHRTDEEAARLILCADVGVLPFRREPFNDAALPYRILKAARLGRKTIVPDLAGVRTWDRAITVAPDAEAWKAALRDAAGARARPDLELRAWALGETAERVNGPLWERLAALGVDGPRDA